MGIIEKIAVDDATMQRLLSDAQKNGRTLEAEAAAWLRRVGGRPSPAELIAKFNAIAAMTPKGIEQTDSTVLVREDRDR
ncbi:MAG: hypothetical protein ABIY37_12270 [Devosia sp.]